MALSNRKRPVKSINPRTLLLFGPPKVGKTTVLSQLDGCMTIDTEEGSHLLSGHFHEVNSKEELLEFYQAATEGHKFQYFALDTIDKLVEWTEKGVCREYSVEHLQDLPYGRGFGLVRDKVMNNIKKLLTLVPRVIIVGHRKVASMIDVNAIEPETLDISGKLRSMIMAHCDAVGYMFRDEETDDLMVSFKGGKALEAGSRCEHLKGAIIPFNWQSIYIKETGK